MEEIKSRVTAFLSRSFQHQALADDDHIFELGLANSMFAMQLVLFVENEFQVSVDNEDLDIDNFKSVNAISAFVERKRAGVAAGA